MADPILPAACDFHGRCRDLLHAENLRHGGDGFTSPPKEGMLRIFRPKNPTASVGFEPANLCTRGPHPILFHCFRKRSKFYWPMADFFFGLQNSDFLKSQIF
jgi:hypothetical protein